MGLAFDPQTGTEHRKRWPAATAKVWHWEELTEDVTEAMDRPGLHRDHVFDFHDGLRLVVSTDAYSFGTYLHVSASCQHEENLDKPLAPWVQERVSFLGGPILHLGYITSAGIPHYFNPALPPEISLTGAVFTL